MHGARHHSHGRHLGHDNAGVCGGTHRPQIGNLVRRSYQYVAMHNVNNKFALKQGGGNTCVADTQLRDQQVREIARPDNDTLYIGCMQTLRKDPVILEMPTFRLVLGVVPRNPDEIAMLTRSMPDLMLVTANFIEVPPEHVAQGHGESTLTLPPGAPRAGPAPITVQLGQDRPGDAFVAV